MAASKAAPTRGVMIKLWAFKFSMVRRLCIYTALFLLAASLLEGCAIVNTMVSLKYELGPPYPQGNGCVSYVTGINLCAALHRHKLLMGGCFLAAFTLVGSVIIADRRSG